MPPPWWNDFECVLEEYVSDNCPPADSSLLRTVGETSFSSGDEPLSSGQFQSLRKALAKSILDACREEDLLEPFARLLGRTHDIKVFTELEGKSCGGCL
jgi:hypothetical protein